MTIRTGIFATVFTLAGCTPAEPPQPVTPKQAVAALATVEGKFAEGGDNVFILLPSTAADGSVLQQVAAFEETVVPALIDCLADTSTSRVTHDGAPTSLGAVCYWALISTRYVQDRIQQGSDNNPAADGWISYQAIDPEQQRRARSEWRAWFARQVAHNRGVEHDGR